MRAAGWRSDCNGAIDGAQGIINTTLPAKLSTLYASIKAKAPNAKVVVVGYPRIFQGEDCTAFTWFSPAEETRLNQTADLLNSKTSAQASAKGFTFANPTGSAFKVSGATLRKAEQSSGPLATQQRRYASVDASIRPEQFRAPDLTTAAAKAAARRAGVDLSSRASIDAADRTWSQRQAAAYAASR